MIATLCEILADFWAMLVDPDFYRDYCWIVRDAYCVDSSGRAYN